MAKVVISLLAAILALNTLIFLVVVSQEGSSGGQAVPTAEGASRGALESLESRFQTIDRLDAAVKSLKSSLDNLSRRVDELPRKVSIAMPRAAPGYSAPTGRAGAAVASQNPPVPARRTGTTDFSQVPAELEGEIEEPEVEVDPSAVDPSAVDPSAMDPSAMDPSAMDPSAMGTEAEVGVPPQPGFEPTEDPASLQGE